MRGYVAERVPGDGSCLFHSLGRQLGLPAAALRAQVADVLRERPNARIEGTKLKDWTAWYAGKPITHYAAEIARPGVWGGALEMAILSRLHARAIHVYEPTPDQRSCKRISVFRVDDPVGPPLRLLYTGGVHYMPLFRQ